MNESITLPLRILISKFDIPHSKRVQFEKIIRTTDPQSQQYLSQTSFARNELIIVIEKSCPSAIITACEKYIPDLYGVILSVEDNGSLRLNEQLSFTWSSFTNVKQFLTGYSLRYELVMTLMVYAMAHYNRASEINDTSDESNFDANAKLIVNHLKIATGVFEFVNRVELPRWSNPPPDFHVECLSNTSLGLSLLCLSLGNALTVRKALKQETSHSVIAKISCESWHKIEMAKNCFRDIGSHNYKKLPKSFRNYISTSISLQHATTMLEMGRDQASQRHYGIALSYLSLSVQYLQKLKKPSDPKQLEILNQLTNEIVYENQSLNKQNELIYYEKKVDVKTLAQPEPKGFLTEHKFEPPVPSFSQIY